MKRRLSFIIVFVLSILMLTGCDFFKGKTQIEFDLNSIPSEIVIGNGEIEEIIRGIRFFVKDKDGEVEVHLDETMISKDDISKFSEVGNHTIRINYNGVSATFTINVIERSENVFFNVTFLDLEGNVIEMITVGKGKDIDYLPEAPVEKGKRFVKWNMSIAQIMQSTADLVVEPIYEDVEPIATISFYGLNGICIKTIEVYEEDYIEFPNAPSYLGYEFISWDRSVDDLMGVRGEIEVYAMYEEVSNSFTPFTVTFVDFEGNIIEERTVSKGNYISSYPVVEEYIEDYKHVGWDISLDYINSIGEDTIVQARYERVRRIKVTYIGFKGIILGEDYYYEGQEYEMLQAPMYIDGNLFAGWDKTRYDIISSTSDIVIYATYVETKEVYVKVVFHLNDEESVTEYLLKGEDAENKIIPYGPDEEHVFIGWDKPLDNLQEDIDVYPIYKSIYDPDLRLKVEFQVYSETVGKDGEYHSGYETIKIEEVKYGGSVVLPDVEEKEGYVFTGWSADYSQLGNIRRNMTIHGEYEKVDKNTKVYKIKYLGFNDKLIYECNYFEGASIHNPEYEKVEGYFCLGWDNDINNITSDLTIRAIYEVDPNYRYEFVVRFYDMYYHVLKEEIVPRGKTATAPVAPEELGYEFIGWINKDFMNNVYYDMDVYPIYRQLDYYCMVIFYDADRQVVFEELLFTEDDPVLFPDPIEIPGTNFLGWDQSEIEIKARVNAAQEDRYVAIVHPVYEYIYGEPSEDAYRIVEIGLGGSIKGYSYETDGFRYRRGNIIEVPGYRYLGTTLSNTEKVYNDSYSYFIYEKIEEHNVKFLDINGNVIEENDSRYYHSEYRMPTLEPVNGKDFLGWDKTLFEIKESSTDVIVKPIYGESKDQIGMHRVVLYYLENGTEYVILDTIVHRDKKLTSLPEILGAWQWNRSLEDLNDWYDNNYITMDRTYVSKVVRFLNADNKVIKEIDASRHEKIVFPEAPEKEGYRFIGWSKNITEINRAVKESCCVYVMPLYQKIDPVNDKYLISFVDVNGNVIYEHDIRDGIIEEYPDAPILDGYKFMGWSKPLDEIKNLTEGCKVYAKYEDYKDAHLFIGEWFNDTSYLKILEETLGIEESKVFYYNGLEGMYFDSLYENRMTGSYKLYGKDINIELTVDGDVLTIKKGEEIITLNRLNDDSPAFFSLERFAYKYPEEAALLDGKVCKTHAFVKGIDGNSVVLFLDENTSEITIECDNLDGIDVDDLVCVEGTLECYEVVGSKHFRYLDYKVTLLEKAPTSKYVIEVYETNDSHEKVLVNTYNLNGIDIYSTGYVLLKKNQMCIAKRYMGDAEVLRSNEITIGETGYYSVSYSNKRISIPDKPYYFAHRSDGIFAYLYTDDEVELLFCIEEKVATIYKDEEFIGEYSYDYIEDFSIRINATPTPYILRYSDNNPIYNGVRLTEVSFPDYMTFKVSYYYDGKEIASERVKIGGDCVNIPNIDDYLQDNHRFMAWNGHTTEIYGNSIVNALFVEVKNINHLVGTYIDKNGRLILNSDFTFVYQEHSGFYEYYGYFDTTLGVNETVTLRALRYIVYFEDQDPIEQTVEYSNLNGIYDVKEHCLASKDKIFEREDNRLGENDYYISTAFNLFDGIGKEEFKMTRRDSLYCFNIYRIAYGTDFEISYQDEKTGKIVKYSFVFPNMLYDTILFDPFRETVTYEYEREINFVDSELKDITSDGYYRFYGTIIDVNNNIYTITDGVRTIEVYAIDYYDQVSMYDVVKVLAYVNYKGNNVPLRGYTSNMVSTGERVADDSALIGTWIGEQYGDYYKLVINDDLTYVYEFLSDSGNHIIFAGIISNGYYERKTETTYYSSGNIQTNNSGYKDKYRYYGEYIIGRNSIKLRRVEYYECDYYLCDEYGNINSFITEDRKFTRLNDMEYYIDITLEEYNQVFSIARLKDNVATKVYGSFSYYKNYSYIKFSVNEPGIYRVIFNSSSEEISVYKTDANICNITIEEALEIGSRLEGASSDCYYEIVGTIKEIVNVRDGRIIITDIYGNDFEVKNVIINGKRDNFYLVNAEVGMKVIVYGKIYKDESHIFMKDADYSIYIDRILGDYSYNKATLQIRELNREDDSTGYKFWYNDPTGTKYGEIILRDGMYYYVMSELLHRLDLPQEEYDNYFTDNHIVILTNEGIIFEGEELLRYHQLFDKAFIYDNSTKKLVGSFCVYKNEEININDIIGKRIDDMYIVEVFDENGNKAIGKKITEGFAIYAQLSDERVDPYYYQYGSNGQDSSHDFHESDFAS